MHPFLCLFSLSLLILFISCFSDTQFFRNDAATFDKEYNKGEWNFLNQLPIERSRCSLVSVLCDSYIPRNGSILDIGCGEGVLSDYLHRSYKKNYLGIDFSSKAIEIAVQKRPKLAFLQADAIAFKPTHQYDAIIFNEMLYYVKHSETVQYYTNFLSPQGIIIVSNWFLESPKNKFENLANLIYEDIIKLGFVAIDEVKLAGYKKSNLRDKVSFRITLFRK